MISYIILFLMLFALEAFYIYAARQLGIVDTPKRRSSHRKPVARGGGIIFYIAVFSCWIWYGKLTPWSILGYSLLAIVSLADDISEIKVGIRLVTQFIAAAFILYGTGVMPSETWVWIVALILGVGLINAFNFMDGINGLLGLYSLIFFLSCSYINVYVVPEFTQQKFIIVMIVACLVFLLFNFRNHALCFAGDVGAIVMGAVVMAFLARLITKSGNIGWLCLVTGFGVDVVLTLCRRIYLRKNIFESHRMHIYQIATNELHVPQLFISANIAMIQMAINIPALWLGWNGWVWLTVSVVTQCFLYYITIRKVI